MYACEYMCIYIYISELFEDYLVDKKVQEKTKRRYLTAVPRQMGYIIKDARKNLFEDVTTKQ